MARINIEDKLFTDERWMNLLLKVGDKDKALGIVCGAWILAQKNWLQYGFIPAKAWNKSFDLMIEVELATRRADGNVYVKGSKKAFQWLDQRSEAGSIGGEAKSRKKSAAARENGRKGGRPPLSEKTQDAPWVISDEDSRLEESDARSNLEGEKPKRDATERNETQRAATSYSFSSSFSSSFSGSNSNSGSKNNTLKNGRKKLTPEQTAMNGRIWEAYASSFFERYRVQPVKNAAVNAKISHLRERLGEAAIEVVKFFLRHNDGFYLKKIHDIGLCLKDAESLHVQMQRGRAITSRDVRNFEKNQGFADLLADREKGGF